MTMSTTLNAIRAHQPCEDGWEKLLKHLGKTKADNEPLPFAVILESNGLDDALWCCRSAPQYDKDWRLLAVAYARRVQHLMTDQRSLNALDVCERYANGAATDDELTPAQFTAWEAWNAAAWEAWDAAAGAAAAAAARTPWKAAAGAAWNARTAARAAGNAEREFQEKMFLETVEGN